MTPNADTDRIGIVFEDFENDVARKPDLRAELEDLARHSSDWADVRRFCIKHDIAFHSTI